MNMINTEETPNTEDPQDLLYTIAKDHLKANPLMLPKRIAPAGLTPAEWLTWAATPEPIGSLLVRYGSLPSAFHVVAALELGQLGLGPDAVALLNHHADFFEGDPTGLEAKGLDRIRFVLKQRQASQTPAFTPDPLPTLDVCRTLWTLNPESPTGVNSIRTGLPIAGVKRGEGLTLSYRPAGSPKLYMMATDVVALLEGVIADEREAAHQAALTEERQTVTTILAHELDALNELFPPSTRIMLIETRMRYNRRDCAFRTWDREARRVAFDTPALLADLKKHVGPRTYDRWVSLAESGVDLAGPLCAHLRIPMLKGSLIYQADGSPPRI